MKSISTIGIRGKVAAIGQLTAALLLTGYFSSAFAQLAGGTINVSSTVYGLGLVPPPTTGSSTNGSLVSVSSFLYDPVNLDFSGTASANATGGNDPSIHLATTGMFGSGPDFTPYNYNVSATIQYSFEVDGPVSNQPAILDINGNVNASGSLFYPAMFDITSTAAYSPIVADSPDEDLLINYFNPELTGSTLNYGVFSPASQNFAFDLFLLTNNVYTITYAANYFSDLAPDAVNVNLDPTVTLDPSDSSADTLLFSQGFGPSATSTVPDGSVPLWIEGTALGGLLLWSRRGRRALS